MNNFITRLGPWVLAGFFLAGTAAADSVIRYKADDGNVHTVMKISDGKVMVQERGQPVQMLYSMSPERMVMINHGKKRYSVMDEAAMKELAAKVDSAMSEMEKQLENLPPEQREQMRKMMDGMLDAGKKMVEPRIERTGRSDEAGGYQCEIVRVTVPDVTRSELCVTGIDSLDISDADRKTLNAMHRHFEAVSKVMSESIGMNIPFNQVGGIPVRITDDQTPGGRVISVNRNSDIGAGEMDVPGSYEQVKLENIGD